MVGAKRRYAHPVLELFLLTAPVDLRVGVMAVLAMGDSIQRGDAGARRCVGSAPPRSGDW
jgi:hypothetical protein